MTFLSLSILVPAVYYVFYKILISIIAKQSLTIFIKPLILIDVTLGHTKSCNILLFVFEWVFYRGMFTNRGGCSKFKGYVQLFTDEGICSHLKIIEHF